MTSGVIAKKVGMSRVFLENGEAIAVTYLKVEPNTVVRTKTQEKDGYNAVILGTGETEKKTKNGKTLKKYKKQKEWKIDSLDQMKAGVTVSSDTIPKDSVVSVTGTSKGKGFQGVIKKHGFSQGPKTHGSHHHRRPGSIGMCEFPGRVLKGKKLPGHAGNATVTLKNRPVIVSDSEKGILGIRGAIPGPNGGCVYITVESLPDGTPVEATSATAS